MHQHRHAGGVRLETGNDALRNAALDQALDVAQQAELVHANQRDRFAAGTGAAGAADAVHIIFWRTGQLEVDHRRQLLDVQAARGDVGGHEYRGLAGFEIGQRLDAFHLRLVAVDGGGMNAVFLQLIREPVHAQARAAEHQHLRQVLRAHQVC